VARKAKGAAKLSPRKAAQKTASNPSETPVSEPAQTPASSSSTLEDLLRAVAAELGLGRAVEILEDARAMVRTFVGA
jgi:hypothetical protein